MRRRRPLNAFRTQLLGALAALAALSIYFYHGGEASRIRIHDNLDGPLATYAVLAKSELFFASSDAVFEQLFNGIPRGSLPSEMHVPLLLYRYLSASSAFIANEFLMRVVALLGMAALLRRHLLPDCPGHLICGVALCFSWLPIFEGVALTVAGQPLLAHALLNLRRRGPPLYSWVIIATYPFFSSLVYIGFVLLPVLALYVAWVSVRERRLHVPLLLALLLLTGGYLASEYRLLAQVFTDSTYVSHRVEFRPAHLSFRSALQRAWEGLLNPWDPATSHAASLHVPFIVLTMGLALLAAALRGARAASGRDEGVSSLDRGRGASREVAAVLALVLACASTSLFLGLYEWTGTDRALDSIGIEVLKMVKFSRVYWLNPFLWSLVFAFSLASIARMRFGRLAATALVACQLLFSIHAQVRLHRDQPLPFDEFYSTELFREIQEHIGRPLGEYRVVSLGMHPSIALYNGFYTLDGYTRNYPLSYKHSFRKVIAREIAKKPRLRERFDDWGNRCYLFSSEIGLRGFRRIMRERGKVFVVQNLAIDTGALAQLGADYIVSAVRIENFEALNLELEAIFVREDSPWTIHLYALPDSSPVRRVSGADTRRK